MHIHCLGLNHQTAGVALRERMAFTEEKTRAALARLGCSIEGNSLPWKEMVILSTCNRVEVYLASPEVEIEAMLSCLGDIHGISPSDFQTHTYHLLDEEAVSHLFRVAAGLDSLVIGEPQILGQVTQALEFSRSQNSAGPLLSRLFQAAIHAGKRARTETHISRNPATISSLAANLAGQVVKDLAEARIVVVGAGEMAELAVEALRKRGAHQITVVNRTLERARELASRWQAAATTFEYLEEALEQSDIAISSTGAPHLVIQYPLVAKVMQGRVNRPLAAIDIAVPRDIDPLAKGLPGFHLYDIDSLSSQLEDSLAERLKEAPKVEAILQDEQARFLEFLKTLDVLPLIADLHQQAESIRQNVLEKGLRRLPGLEESEKAQIEAMTRSLVKRLLDAPIAWLRSEAGSSDGPEYALIARTLFGLTDQDQEHRLPPGAYQ
jgi:glutamyl-tRNA reductase